MHSTSTSRATTARLLAAAFLLAFAPSLAHALLARSGNTATLLPDGTVISVGGSATVAPGGGWAGGTTEFNRLGIASFGPNLPNTFAEDATANIARSSHTATLLPDGSLLVAGGIAADLTVRRSLVIYSPKTGAWTDTGRSLSSGRYNHTATLLRNGQVLICGGSTVPDPGAGLTPASQTCDIYTMNGMLGCATPGGCLTGPIGMITARSLQTATLLPTGDVFITGGYDAAPDDFNSGVAGAIATSEIYKPGLGFFVAAHSLIQERYNHTATLMGDGRVLIVGGFNGKNVKNDFGMLASAEIYDPISDSMSPAGPLNEPRQNFAIAINPDGSLNANGGLGNVTTAFLNASPCSQNAVLDNSSIVVGTDGGVANGVYTTNITGGVMSCPADFHVIPTVNGLAGIGPTGIVESGFIEYLNPSVTPPAGLGAITLNGGGKMNQITWLPDPTKLFSDLQGTVLSVENAQPGAVKRDLTFQGVNGALTWLPILNVSANPANATAGSINFFPSPISTYSGAPLNISNGNAVITAGSFSLNLTIPSLPSQIDFATIFEGEYDILDGKINVTDNATGNLMATISLTGGKFIFPVGSGSVNGAGTLTFSGPVTAGNLSGTIVADTPTISGISSPETTAGQTWAVSGLVGTLKYNASLLNIGGGSLFITGTSTITIKSMDLGDQETYDPASNSWAVTNQLVLPFSWAGALAAPQLPSFGGKEVVAMTGDQLIEGGRACDPGTFPLWANYNSSCPDRSTVDNSFVVPYLGAWSQAGPMVSPRSNLTATGLPSGKILLAGGSNGPNVLNSAELYDPNTGTSQATGSMATTRDLHTATLLPNGRVLVAGGFTTSGSSASTNGAEVFIPNEGGYWIPTSSMTFARDNHAAVLGADGNPIIIGGYNAGNGQYLDKVEVYFSTSGTWAPLPHMINQRALFAATELRDGRIMVAGGINGQGPLRQVEIYNPSTTPPAWSAAANMPVALYGHRASMLLDGRVLISGGSDGLGETVSSLIYDPGSNSWIQTNPLNNGRLNHDALVLPNGVVVAVGGAQSVGQSLASVETFDIYSSTWSLQAGNVLSNGQRASGLALSTARAFQATVLTNNNVIFTFGGENNGTVLGSVESIYFQGSNPDTLSVGAPPSALQASITSVDVPAFDHVSTITLSGVHFRGKTGSSSGGADDADFEEPRIVLQALDGGGGSGSQGTSAFFLDLSTRIYSTLNPATGRLYNLTGNGATGAGSWTIVDSSISIAMPSALDPSTGQLPNSGEFLPYGWYQLRTNSSSMFSNAVTVHSGPFLPSTSVGTLAPIANPDPGFYDSGNPCSPGQLICENGNQVLTQTPTVWVTSNTVVWQWQNLSAPVNGGFDVYSATTGVFVTTISYSTNVFVQTGLAPNTTVSLIVAPFNLSGDGPLTYSTTFFTLSTAPVTGAFSISSVAFAGLQLSWLTNGNQPGTIYEVSESTDDPIGNGLQPFSQDVSTPVPVSVGLTITSTTITGLLSSKTYYFRIRALNGAGLFSNFSGIVSTATRHDVGTPGIASETTTSITWGWADALIIGHYNVYSASSSALMGMVPESGSPQFTETSLSTNSAYSIRISAVTGAGEGPLSTSATYFTMAAAPAFVSGPNSGVVSLSSANVTVQWQANGNPAATLYRVGLRNVSPLDAGLPVNITSITVLNAGAGLITATFNDADITQQANTGPNFTGGVVKSRGYPPAQVIAVNVQAFNGDLNYAFNNVVNGPATTQEAPSSVVLLTPLNGGTTSLAAADPYNLVANNPLGTGPTINSITNSAIAISWASNNNASSATYEVYMSSDPKFADDTQFLNAVAVSTPLAFSAQSNQTSLTVPNLQTGTTYYFRYRNADIFGIATRGPKDSGYSPASNPALISNGGAPPGSVNAVIDPNQNVTVIGTLAGGRQFTLFVPANTFSQVVTLTISTQTFGGVGNPATCPGGGPYGFSFTVTPPLEPLHPAYLTLNYTPVDIAGVTNLSQLALERVDSSTGKCVPLATTVNQPANQVTATINHFSIFELGQLLPSSSVESTLIFPNPFMPSQGNGYVTFSQVPAQSHIQIYTLKGALVSDGYANVSGIYIWGGINEAGRPVASGIYLAVVRSGDTKKIFKVVVLR